MCHYVSIGARARARVGDILGTRASGTLRWSGTIKSKTGGWWIYVERN